MILTPTRELALQISECIDDYAKYTQVRHGVIFGGVNQRAQVNMLHKGVDILVATPGRLLDLMNQGYIHLDNVRHFVLDEADRMLDMGFIHDIKRLLPKLPKEKADFVLLGYHARYDNRFNELTAETTGEDCYNPKNHLR